MTDREKALETQCKVLADRLAIALAIFSDLEITYDLDERRDKDERNPWREAQLAILSNHEIWKAERKDRRKVVFYGCALDDVRRFIKQNMSRLRAQKEAA